MRTIAVTVYNFDELPAIAQNKVIQDAIEKIEFDNTAVIEDAITIGKLFGLEIDNVLYSGFWSQGDGASFTGRYQFCDGGFKAVTDYAPLDLELRRIVSRLNAHAVSINYTIHITQSGRYFHENTMNFDTDDSVIIGCLRDYARWIYKRLENEYDYQTSREYIIELITGNGDEFYADGSKFIG